MIDFQLAPCIIAGLLVVTGYMFTRWLSNLGELRLWKDLAANLQDTIDGMREEGCAAQGALEKVFNSVTADGMPHSKLVKRVAEIASEALVMVPVCEHKAQALDNEGRIEHAIIRAENWERIADRLADEQIQTKRDIAEAVLRAEEAERLLGLVQEKLVVSESDVTRMREFNDERSQADYSTPPLPYERGDVPEADD